MSRSTVHKNYNLALPNFGLIALCSFLYFELCQGQNSETTTGIIKKLERLILLSRSVMHKSKLGFIMFELLLFVTFHAFFVHNVTSIV